MARILVVDDDVEQVTLQRRLLETFGHELDGALSVQEALSQLKNCKPDLVVIDLRIPQVEDGLDLIRRVRASGYAGPVILLSGWPDDIYGAPEEQMVTRVLVKGNIRELLQAIAELVA